MATAARFCTTCGSPLDDAGRCPKGHAAEVDGDPHGARAPTPPPSGGAWPYCIHCGATLDADGRCPLGHAQTAADLAAGPSGASAISRSLILAWRLIARQPRVLWLAVEGAVVGAVWLLVLIALVGIVGAAVGQSGAFGGGRAFGIFGGLGRVPWYMHIPLLGRFTALALSGGGGMIAALGFWYIAGLFVFLPYGAGATMRGLIRALDDDVRPAQFWSDGRRFFGRSYLAGIAAALVGVVPLAVALVWSTLLFLVGHVIGPVLGVLGVIVVFVAGFPFVGVVGTGVYQSAWPGLRQSLTLVRSRWLVTVGLLIVLSLITVVASVIGSLLYVIPVLGWIVGALLPTSAWLFATTAVLLYYREANGVASGSWAVAAAVPGARAAGGAGAFAAGGSAAGEVAGAAMGNAVDLDWSAVQSLLPQWGALLRQSVQEAIPTYLGSPKDGAAVFAEALRPPEALALPVDALVIFGALLAGLGRPLWAWPLGAAIGFVFGVLWSRLMALAAVAVLRAEGVAVAAGEALRSVSIPFMVPLFLAVVDIVLAPMTHSYLVATVLCFGSLLGTLPFAVGALQAHGASGWRSVLLGCGTTLAILLPWLLLAMLFRHIR